MSGEAKARVACIGGGVIGGGWVARFLLRGHDVAVYDPHPESTRIIGEVLANAEHAHAALGLPEMRGTLVQAGSIAEAVTGAAYIQESVPERIEVKAGVLAEIEASAAPETVVGSSTSGFKPSELRAGRLHPDRIIVAHPFNPVYLLPLVELVGAAGGDAATAWAAEFFGSVGMHPLVLRKEIDAHIADRLMEAVWREALWLVKDGVATTEEIDDSIRYGFGLRWAQMGLFETFRIAGGEAGMRHFLAQFGPALQWPWTKLMDVPELDDAFVETIASQSDAQSGAHEIRELERIRDDNLVAILKALRASQGGAGWGAGKMIPKD